MQIKKVLLLTIILIGAAVATANAACNSSYVNVNGSTITVLPTGSDDTANLKCAFDLGIGIPGAVVQLARGTYITDRIIVDGFVGTLRGAGNAIVPQVAATFVRAFVECSGTWERRE